MTETVYTPAGQSAEINELAKALAKAQSKMTGAIKDSENPFLQSSYADLSSVIDASRDALAENDLAIIQTTERGTSPVYPSTEWVEPLQAFLVGLPVTDRESILGDRAFSNDLKKLLLETSRPTYVVRIITTLVHGSGQWIRSTLDVPFTKNNPQTLGGCITYGRRYSRAAIVGLAQVDDDGIALRTGKVEAPSALKDTAKEVAETGLNGLQDWFKALPKSDREALTSDPKWWEGLKRVASGNSNASAA